MSRARLSRHAAVAALALCLGAVPSYARKDELGPYGQLPPAHCAGGGASPGQDGAWLQTAPPLFAGLGTHSRPIRAANPEAQAFFDQGLRLAYAFNHAEARRAFIQAQRLDPGCALCAWGEALVLGPNINKPMDPADNGPALAALSRARRNIDAAAPPERALIEALSARYSADPAADRARLDGAYAEAMLAVARRFAEDADIQVLAAEAAMDAQPWDYWAADRRTPKGRHGEAVALLERVLAAQPDHPGAIHLYIHAVEASDDPGRALTHARRLTGQMPAAGHIVHMPSHIYYRVGLWGDSLATNRDAVRADEDYLAQVRAPSGIYRDGYYPHNIHFLLVSAQMGGDGATAIAAAEKLAATVTEQGAGQIPWAQPIKAAPYFTHAQYSAPDMVLGLPDPGDGLPYVKALWHYARGVALAKGGNTAGAEGEVAAIRRYAADPRIAELAAAGVPAPDVLDIAVHVVQGRMAQAEGRLDEAVARFTEAVLIEDRLSYTEPPWWYYPVRQSLGATLLMAGDHARAEQVFREALARVPNNGWALWGLAQAQRQGGDPAADETEQAFGRAWIGAAPAPRLGSL